MKIVPVTHIQFPLNATVDEIEITVNRFTLFTTAISVNWRLTGPNNIVRQGVMDLPASIISNWGTDDTIVKEYVLQQLNLTEDTTP